MQNVSGTKLVTLVIYALAVSIVAFFDSESGAQSTPKKEKIKRTYYLEIPIVGGIGFDPNDPDKKVTAFGLEDALNWASRQKKIEYIVFRVDSGGGSALEGEKLSEVMRSYHDQFVYIALVEKSISAAMFITLNCDRIFMLNPSSQGATVAWSRDESGNVKVNAKMNAAWTKGLTSIAESNGHSAAIVNAMGILKKEVYSWKDSNGDNIVSNRKPESSDQDYRVVDGPETILALTAQESVDLGFAEALPNGVKSLGKILGHEKWKSIGRYGEVRMRKADQKMRKDEANRQSALARSAGNLVHILRLRDQLNPAIETARYADPNNFGYSTEYTRDGYIVFTSQSIQLWRQRTDTAIAAWDTVLNIVNGASTRYKNALKDWKLVKRYPPYWNLHDQHEKDLKMIDEESVEVQALEGDFQRASDEAMQSIRMLRASYYRSAP